jgi:DNA-binding NtrC family response regulator
MTSSRRVLIVDDDADSQFAVGSVLELEHYEVATVGSGADALALLRDPSARPQVVVLDVHLRDMSGLDVLAAISEERGLAPVGVVVVTGDRAVAEELRRQGRSGVVEKPFSIATLLAEIAKVQPS